MPKIKQKIHYFIMTLFWKQLNSQINESKTPRKIFTCWKDPTNPWLIPYVCGGQCCYLRCGHVHQQLPQKNCWSLFCYLSFLYFDQVSLFICLTKMQNWHSSFQYFSFQSSNFQFYHFNPQTFNCCQFGTPLDLSYLLLLSESKRCRFFFFWVIKKN